MSGIQALCLVGTRLVDVFVEDGYPFVIFVLYTLKNPNTRCMCYMHAGKPKSIRETFDEVFKSIPYCVQLAGGPYIETNSAVVPAFRPPADRRTAATKP
jgi:hypothetical protein